MRWKNVLIFLKIYEQFLLKYCNTSTRKWHYSFWALMPAEILVRTINFVLAIRLHWDYQISIIIISFPLGLLQISHFKLTTRKLFVSAEIKRQKSTFSISLIKEALLKKQTFLKPRLAEKLFANGLNNEAIFENAF